MSLTTIMALPIGFRRKMSCAKQVKRGTQLTVTWYIGEPTTISEPTLIA
jgi:hypothetical protein